MNINQTICNACKAEVLPPNYKHDCSKEFVAALQKENAKLRSALVFYVGDRLLGSDAEIYNQIIRHSVQLRDDSGKIAREAL